MEVKLSNKQNFISFFFLTLSRHFLGEITTIILLCFCLVLWMGYVKDSALFFSSFISNTICACIKSTQTMWIILHAVTLFCCHERQAFLDLLGLSYPKKTVAMIFETLLTFFYFWRWSVLQFNSIQPQTNSQGMKRIHIIQQ